MCSDSFTGKMNLLKFASLPTGRGFVAKLVVTSNWYLGGPGLKCVENWSFSGFLKFRKWKLQSTCADHCFACLNYYLTNKLLSTRLQINPVNDCTWQNRSLKAREKPRCLKKKFALKQNITICRLFICLCGQLW